jgi:hypothetical protein
VPLAQNAVGLTAALATAMEDDDMAKRYALRPFSLFPPYQIPESFHTNLMCVCLISVDTPLRNEDPAAEGPVRALRCGARSAQPGVQVALGASVCGMAAVAG